MSAKSRERYAVVLLAEDAVLSDPGPAPDIGAPSEWVPCGLPRALAVKYMAGDKEKLPQAKAVKSALAAWAKSR
ncbi:MAG: hypothetical protein H5T97_07620, partial [Firmicutes bacterium]|nr:hypothetical protein [Bacillota bacterium]